MGTFQPGTKTETGRGGRPMRRAPPLSPSRNVRGENRFCRGLTDKRRKIGGSGARAWARACARIRRRLFSFSLAVTSLVILQMNWRTQPGRWVSGQDAGNRLKCHTRQNEIRKYVDKIRTIVWATMPPPLTAA